MYIYFTSTTKNDSSSTSILTSNVSNTPKSNHFPKSFSIPHFWGDVVDPVLKKIMTHQRNRSYNYYAQQRKYMHSINDLHQLSVIV